MQEHDEPQQPESEPTPQPGADATEQPKGDPLADGLKALGFPINPDLIRAALRPLVAAEAEGVAERVVSAAFAKIPDMIESGIAQGLNAFAGKLTQQLGSVAPADLQAGAQAPAGGLGGLGSLLSPGLVEVIAGRLLGPQTGNQVESITGAVGTMKMVFENVIGPLAELQESARRDAYMQMNALSRTGGRLPWESEPEPAAPAAREPAAAPAMSKGTTARDVARNINVGGMIDGHGTVE